MEAENAASAGNLRIVDIEIEKVRIRKGGGV
jgi:hypothetical protein